MMQVSLVNQGPITILLDTERLFWPPLSVRGFFSSVEYRGEHRFSCRPLNIRHTPRRGM